MKQPVFVRPHLTGFALVITLSLMILLTVIAVGLLSLSSISLRASAQGNAMAMAQANARLALMLAIGDLQKNAGPDQSVTARADVIPANSANPHLTGVWKSWEIKATEPPSPTEYEKAARDAKFLGWLVSGTDPAETAQIAYATKAPVSAVTLWGQGTLGAKTSADQFVNASKIPLAATFGSTPGTTSTPGTPTGALAWAVLDEGVKVRINTRYADDATTVGAKTAELGAGERPGVEFIAGLNGLERKFFEKKANESATIDKGISRLNFALAGENLAAGVREALQPLTHDVTTQSVGLFTDTARGGIKQDLQLLLNADTLPAAYQNKGVYNSRWGMTPATAPSDPKWATLQELANLYRTKITKSGEVPVIKAQTPAGWAAATTSGTTTTVNRTPPPGVVLLPTIAKVQMLFSIHCRDMYYDPIRYPRWPDGTEPPKLTPAIKLRNGTPSYSTNWLHAPISAAFSNTPFDYELQLLYTPVVTLHNPYNVALEFTDMRLDFLRVPFAMQVFRNGIAQTTKLVPLETMFWQKLDGAQGRVFGMKLKNKTAAGAVAGDLNATKITLLPGEVKTFSPYIDPNHTWFKEMRGPGKKFLDIDAMNQFTGKIDAIPGWQGDGIGFACAALQGNEPYIGQPDGCYQWSFGWRWDDALTIKFAPVCTTFAANKFVIQMKAKVEGSPSPPVVSAIEMDYASLTGLQDFILGKDGTMTYPSPTATPVKGKDMLDHSTTPIKEMTNVKPFALLSAQAKTTSGARDSSNIDGRLATKPWCFAHANIAASSQKVISEHSANFAHEIDLQLLPGSTANLIQVYQDRGNFISGHSATNGTKFGLQYEIPLTPLQTLAGLNGANPGGASFYLPRFAQPIGNSWAHPLIAPSVIVRNNADSNLNEGKNYLDHSFLLNLAFYDGFYFSGLADQTGPFGSSARTAANLAASFANDTPLDDPRLVLHSPDGKPATDFAGVVAKPAAYQNVAAWQMMQGAFNVNSTSVAAWKAMLASIHDQDALFNQLDKTNKTSSLAALTVPAAGQKARVSRFRLPAAESAAVSADLKDSYWLGPREYSDAELQTLADHIVKQVKARGPFLSLAEFVNRRLGAETDAKAQRGALQQAIDDSGLNQKTAADANAGFEIQPDQVKDYKYQNPTAGTGSSYQGAPGYLSQADLLNVLGNAATPRSDTFTIRGYGEARDPQGKILAKATCEAVVQRYPEWLDPADKVETAPDALTSTANKTFGRRFLVTSLRWLKSNEI